MIKVDMYKSADYWLNSGQDTCVSCIARLLSEELSVFRLLVKYAAHYKITNDYTWRKGYEEKD